MSTPPIAENTSSSQKKPLSNVKPTEDPLPEIIAKAKIASPTTQTEPKRIWQPSKGQSERVTNAAFANVVNSNTPENTAYYLWSRGQMQSKKPLSEALQDNEELPLDLAVKSDQDELLRSLLGIEEKQTKQPSSDLESFYSKCLVQAKKENLIGQQILYLLKLTGIYIGKAKAEKEQVKKENFLIVGAKILNCALILVPNQNTLFQNYLFKRLEEIETLFLECQGVKVIIKKDTIRESRKRLNDIRKTAEISHQNGKSIQETLLCMTQDFIQLLRDLISQTQELLPPAPVKWAAMGMGSMSREEMCPYSDVDCAFLIDKESQEALNYFRKLSKILELKIINLGETKFPVFGGEFDSPTPDGFCMDVGGNTPLGVTGVYELIGTPKTLAQFQTVQWMDRSIILPNAMSHVCFIAGKERLIVDYNKEKAKVQNLIDKKATDKNRNVLSLRLLQGHVEEFAPNLTKEKEEISAFGIKKELYRPFQEIIGSLALFYQLKAKTTFTRIDELVDLNIFSSKGGENLKKAITHVLKLRLQAHLFYQNEEEFLCHPEEGKPLDPRLMYLNQETIEILHEVYRILIPFHRCSEEFLKSQNNKAFQSSSFYDERSKDQGQAFDKNLQYAKSQEARQQVVALNPNNVSALVELGVIEDKMGKGKDALPRYIKALEIARAKYGENHSDVATCYNCIGIVHNNLGEFEKALEYFPKALKISLQVLGENHPDVATSYNNMGEAYRLLGEYKKSLGYYQKALTIELKILGENHPDVAAIYNNMGIVHQRLGEYEKALEYCQKALNIKLQVLGEKHPDVAITYNSIGAVYYRLGEYEKALEYCQKALNIKLPVLGEKHPDVAITYNSIGMVYYQLGEYKKAFENYQKTLKISLQVFSENHTFVATSYNNIGEVYNRLGEYEKALEYCQKAFKISLQVLGENHPLVAFSCNNIGEVYQSLGEYEKASEYHQKALKIRLQLFGENHPDIARSYNNIGKVYKGLENSEKALEYYQKALSIKLQVLGEKHPDVAITYNSIGAVYYQLGEYEKALEYCQKALNIKLPVLGEKHPDVATSYNSIGMVYYQLGENEKAFENYQKALKISLQVFSENHPDVAASYNNIGGVYYRLGEYEKTLECYLNSLKIWLQFLEENHPDVAKSYNNIGLVYNKLENYEKALEFHQNSLKSRLQVLEENHPDIAKSYNNVGLVYNKLENYEKALEFYQNSLKIWLQVLEENHPDIAKSYNNVGNVYYRLRDYENALSSFKLSLEMQCKIYKKSHPTLLTTLSGVIGVAKALPVSQPKSLQSTYDLCVQTLGAEHEQVKALGQLISSS